uniref:Uncharacterized protein n=1 Tax=Meloidogyne javanica TaxID=6303 RepID=A0A915MTR9_MELJA
MQSQTSGVASVGNNNSDNHQQSPIEPKLEHQQRPQTSETNFPNRRPPQAESTGNGQTQACSNSVAEGGTGPCGGCVELRREVEELRQMLFQMQNESSAFSTTSAASRFRQQHPQHIQKPQSPPSPPHPSIPQPVLQQTFQSTTNQQLRQALLLQNQAAINNSNSQGQAQQQFQHSGNANNYNSHVLQLFLSQASANQQQHSQHSQNLSHPPVPMSSASSSSTSATNPATAPGVNRILEQIGQQLDIATLQGNGSNPTAQQSTEKQQQQLLVSTIQMLQQAAQIQQINGQASQQQGSGASTRNNSIQSGESVFYDPSNMDVSETSSSSSSTNAQLDLISAAISRTNAAVTSHLLSPAHGGETNVIQQQQQQCTRHHDPSNHHQLLQHHAQHERVVVVERRRAASDDYIQSICSQKYTEEYIQQIQIPVPEAHACDPNFRPLTEQQVIQQVLQNKKYENQSVAETMAQLCKKLAEKRVFGSRLMSKTTVAAPNHSSYSNLPLPGIIYIYYVCQKVLFKRVEKEEEFKECFRDAMRKLAARCRRVRHARKNHNSRHGIAVSSGGLDNPSLMLGSQATSAFTQCGNNSHGTHDSNNLAATELASRISDVATGNGCSHSPLGATLENTVCITSQPSNVEKMEISEDNGPLKEEINSVERELMDEELLDEDLGCCPLSSPTISSQSTGEASITHQQSPGDADRDSIDTNDVN